MKKINLLIEERLTGEGLFAGVRVTIKDKYSKLYNEPFDVDYIPPSEQDEMKSDTLTLLFSKSDKGIVIMRIYDKSEYEKKELIRINKNRKELGLPKLKSVF